MSESLSEENSNKPAEVVKATAAKAKPAATRKGLGRVFGVFITILALLALAASAYVYYLFDAATVEQSQLVKQYQKQQVLMGKSQNLLVQQQQTISSLQSKIQSVEAQQLYLYESANGLKRRLQELSYTDRSDWQLAEIEYLLRLAHQRVVSNSNAKLGLELLLSADELLRELDNADLYIIREQIASDSLALRNVVDIDIEGVYLALNAVAAQIEALQFNKLELKPHAAETEEKVSLIESAWQKLASLYRVTPRQGLVEPLYTLQQQQAIEQQLILLIAQAKQALLTASSALFAASLEEAKTLAFEHVIDTEQRRLFIAQLDNFQAIDISPELPDISGSHAKMRAYTDSKRQRALVRPSTPVISDEATP